MTFRRDKHFLCSIVQRRSGHDPLLIFDGYYYSRCEHDERVFISLSVLSGIKMGSASFYRGIYWRHSFGHYTMALSDWVLDRHEHERWGGKGNIILGLLHLG